MLEDYICGLQVLNDRKCKHPDYDDIRDAWDTAQEECAKRCIDLIIANGLSEVCVKEIKTQFLHDYREVVKDE